MKKPIGKIRQFSFIQKRNRLRIIFKIILITLALWIILLAAAPFIAIPIFLNRHVSYRGYATEQYPMQDVYYASDFDMKETIRYLNTEDGYHIWTSEISAENPKAVIIYLSGIIQPSVTYFYGHANYMKKNGYASFLLEVRGHGNSDGTRICLGYEEANDVKAVVDYIRSDPNYDNVPIVLHGVSMGGAIAINAFGQNNEIDGLIAMSPYSSFEDVVIDIMDHYRVPDIIQSIEKPLLSLSLKTIFGTEAVKHNKPLVQIKNTRARPALIIACTGDTQVPAENTQRLKDANPEVKIWLRNSWEHFIVKDCDFKQMSQDIEYCYKIIDFLNKNFAGRKEM